MAKVKNNIVTQGLSGTLGNTLVFRQYKGTTVAATKSVSRKEPSGEQLKHRQRFQEAVIYSKSQMADPEAKAEYEARKGDSTAFLVAVADFFHAPDIVSVDLSDYEGQPEDRIVVRVTDDFRVMWVKIQIFTADGNLLEEGNATLGNNGLDWVYQAREVNANPEGDRIVVQAGDKPGNITQEGVEGNPVR